MAAPASQTLGDGRVSYGLCVASVLSRLYGWDDKKFFIIMVAVNPFLCLVTDCRRKTGNIYFLALALRQALLFLHQNQGHVIVWECPACLYMGGIQV